MPFPRFDYMEFAKIDFGPAVRHPLAWSGFNIGDPAAIGVDPAAVRLLGPVGYGDPGVRARIAARYRVPDEHALPIQGTSMGIFLVAAALLEPGDRVLVEAPAYEPLVKVPEVFGAHVDRFERRLDEGWVVDPDRVARAMTPKTKLVVITNLHNPSGVRLSDEVESALVDLAAARGITLFVDEVYRDFLPGPVGTAYRPGTSVVVASSLTKVYGMGGLRAGWLLGPPELLHRAARVVDMLYVNDPFPLLPYVAAAHEAADRLRETHVPLAEAGQAQLDAWMRAHPAFGWVRPDGGLCAFPRLPEGFRGADVHRRLLEEEATLVVPGHFFEDDRHIRIGVGAGAEALAGGLAALERVTARLKIR